MLKLVGIFIGVALIVAALAAVVWAQGPRNGDGACNGCDTAAGDGLQRGRRYNQESDAPQQGRGPFANGETPCDEFVDEDGDGVCDDCGAAEGDGLQRGQRFNQDENERGPYSGTGGRMGGARMRTP